MEQNSNITLYETAAETIKTAILQGQYEALKSENRVQLAVYFGIGKFISSNSRMVDGELMHFLLLVSCCERFCQDYEVFLPHK